MEGKRPRGVTIISILMIISGVASILIGLAILAGSISLSLVAQGSDVGALAGGTYGSRWSYHCSWYRQSCNCMGSN